MAPIASNPATCPSGGERAMNYLKQRLNATVHHSARCQGPLRNRHNTRAWLALRTMQKQEAGIQRSA